MNLVIGSAFRNSSCRGHLQRYFQQVEQLIRVGNKRGDTIRLISVEGDSADNTHLDLQRYARYMAVPQMVVKREHGCREWGSTEEPERMAKLSYVGNGILESVAASDDVLIYVESDLLWRADVMFRLIDQLSESVHAISPLVFAGEAFYDIWAFRAGGWGNEHRFGPFHPFHPECKFDALTPMASTGSCIVMWADVARKCRIINGEALVGFGKDLASKGFKLFCDARERIHHPA